MNKVEFTKYIAGDFDCSLEAADAVITIFSESLGNTLSKGYSSKLETLREFKLCSIPLRNFYSFKQNKTLTTQACKQLYLNSQFKSSDLYLRLSKELTNQKIL